jgi:hypothetical protein
VAASGRRSLEAPEEHLDLQADPLAVLIARENAIILGAWLNSLGETDKEIVAATYYAAVRPTRAALAARLRMSPGELGHRERDLLQGLRRVLE